MNPTAIEIFIRRKIRQYFPGPSTKRARKLLKGDDFVIISRNCWGGQVYQWLGLPYNTPFVGLYLFGPCYLKLLKDFDRYMGEELQFVEASKYYEGPRPYPLGMLGDVEIHFEHYSDEAEAREKWERRKHRMLKCKDHARFFYTLCGRREVTEQTVEEFHALPFAHKLSFSYWKQEGRTEEEHVQLYRNQDQDPMMGPNGKKLFKLTFLYMDIVHWLNTGKVIRTRFKD